jgi:hypothetical protein
MGNIGLKQTAQVLNRTEHQPNDKQSQNDGPSDAIRFFWGELRQLE